MYLIHSCLMENSIWKEVMQDYRVTLKQDYVGELITLFEEPSIKLSFSCLGKIECTIAKFQNSRGQDQSFSKYFFGENHYLLLFQTYPIILCLKKNNHIQQILSPLREKFPTTGLVGIYRVTNSKLHATRMIIAINRAK